MKSQIQSRFSLGKLLAAAAACLAFQSAQATLLFQDGLNYPAGSLNASDVSPAGLSGNAWSSGSSHITVASGNLTYPGMLDLGGNEMSDAWGVSAGSVINTYANQSSGTIYYSFLVDCTSIGTANSYLTALNPSTTAPGGSGDALSAYVKSSGSGWQIGVRTTPAAISEDTAAGVLSFNTTYLVVMSYTLSGAGAGTANMWVDPSSSTFGGTAPTADVSLTGGTSAAIDDVGFKAQGTAATGGFLLDNITVGTAWADVTPAAAPEPSALALAGLGALGLLSLRGRFCGARQ